MTYSINNRLSSIKILGTSITNASKHEVLEYIFTGLENKHQKFYIVTPNPEILMYAVKHREYQEILNHAQVSLPDGIGVLISARLLQKHIIGRITGVDMMYDICHQASKRALTVGFLGGRGGVAEKTSLCLQKKYPGLIVNFAGEEWLPQKSDYRLPISEESGKLRLQIYDKKNISSSIQKSKIRNQYSQNIHVDILFVAFGFPKQEEWIAKNLPNIDVTCAMGVGGAFDYISGKVPRAPKLIRSAGMEWAYRLIRQPWRIKRQLALPLFVFEVLKERIRE